MGQTTEAGKGERQAERDRLTREAARATLRVFKAQDELRAAEEANEAAQRALAVFEAEG